MADKMSTKAQIKSEIVEMRKALLDIARVMKQERWFDAAQWLMEIEGSASALRAEVEHYEHAEAGEVRYDCHYCD